MPLFDLVFLLGLAATAVALVSIFVALVWGRKSAALRILRLLGLSLALYLLVVTVAAVLAPQRVLKMGQDRCFDEMCFAPTRVRVMPTLGPAGRQVKAAGNFYVVDVRASSHAHGRAQREAGVNASLIDAASHTYRVSSQGQKAYEAAYGPSPELTSRLQAGESVNSVQVFDVPRDASGLSFHLGHDGPGLFIIGDDESPLHKPTVTPLK